MEGSHTPQLIVVEESDKIALAPFVELVGSDVMGLIFEVAPRKVAARVSKSLDHYRKALHLIGVDEEMGVIRLVAAEEELVVAIFEWLKLNADTMPEHRDFVRKAKNHRVKLAFYPVLSMFGFVLGDMLSDGITMEGLEDVMHWQVSAVRIDNFIRLRIADANGKEITTHNPLAVGITSDGRSDAEVVDALFRDFVELVREQRNMSAREFITARADYRNKLLYAEDAGYLEMDDNLQTLLDSVFRTTFRDLLWCLAVLLTNTPVLREWGLVSQFIALYRRVLTETRLI